MRFSVLWPLNARKKRSFFGARQAGGQDFRESVRPTAVGPLLVQEKARFLVPLLVSFLSDVKVALQGTGTPATSVGVRMCWYLVGGKATIKPRLSQRLETRGAFTKKLSAFGVSGRGPEGAKVGLCDYVQTVWAPVSGWMI
jgi:hypothetical protein